MIYRGPGFLFVIWFGSSPIPSPYITCQQVVSPSSSVSLVEFTDERRGKRGGNGDKPWSSVNQSLLSGTDYSSDSFWCCVAWYLPCSCIEFCLRRIRDLNYKLSKADERKCTTVHSYTVWWKLYFDLNTRNTLFISLLPVYLSFLLNRRRR